MTPKDWDRNEAAIKAAKEEILEKIAETGVKIDAGVTPQTKKFTEFVWGTANIGDEKPLQISGSGVFYLHISSGVYISIDGKEYTFMNAFASNHEYYPFYFNTSIMLKPASTTEQNIIYYVQS